MNAFRTKSNEMKNAATTIALALAFCLAFSCRMQAEESYQAEREKVEKMSDAEKAELLRKFKQFNGLDAEEQVKLRKLHDEIEKDPEAKELLSVMDGYSKWLETIPAFERTQLQSMSASERIEWIKKRMQERGNRWLPRGLTAKDAETLQAWFRSYAEKNKEALAEKLPKEQRERIEAEIKPEYRATLIASFAFAPRKEGQPAAISDDELATIEGRLSSEAREALKGKKSDEKKKLVLEWLARLYFMQFGPRRDIFNEDMLAKFFEKLPEEDRNRLLNLPVDQMQRQLLQLYFRQEGFMAPGFDMPGRGRGGDQRRGDGMRQRGPGGEGQKPDFNGPPPERGQPQGDGPEPPRNPPSDQPPREGEKKDDGKPAAPTKPTDAKPVEGEKTAAGTAK